jgi:hypothetical protein
MSQSINNSSSANHVHQLTYVKAVRPCNPCDCKMMLICSVPGCNYWDAENSYLVSCCDMQVDKFSTDTTIYRCRVCGNTSEPERT